MVLATQAFGINKRKGMARLISTSAEIEITSADITTATREGVLAVPIQAVVVREVDEEVGIAVSEPRYFGSQPWPFPNSLMIGFTARYAGYSCQEVAHDYHKAFLAARRCAADFDWDAVVANMVYVWTGLTQAMGTNYYGVPGIDVPPDKGFQYREPKEENAFMREDEYDELIDDPTAFLYNKWLPRISDGQLLFLQHMVAHMRPVEQGGSRVAIIMNGSPLFTGGAGSGRAIVADAGAVEMTRHVYERHTRVVLIELIHQSEVRRDVGNGGRAHLTAPLSVARPISTLFAALKPGGDCSAVRRQ